MLLKEVGVLKGLLVKMNYSASSKGVSNKAVSPRSSFLTLGQTPKDSLRIHTEYTIMPFTTGFFIDSCIDSCRGRKVLNRHYSDVTKEKRRMVILKAHFDKFKKNIINALCFRDFYRLGINSGRKEKC